MSTDKRPTSPIAADLSTMHVALSLPCARCGYDVRGLSADGDCPECGEPIRFTIIEVVDPATRRLPPIHKPAQIGNMLLGTVFFYLAAFVLAVLASVTRVPDTLPIPQNIIASLDMEWLVWGSACSGLIAMFHLVPMMHICKQFKLEGLRLGVLLAGSGLMAWSISMILIPLFMTDQHTLPAPMSMLLDTVFPVLASGFVLSGFRKLVPRLGQRCRAFRHAQSSRQRMNDLLAALIVLVVGRTLVAVAPQQSNLSFLGTIVMVMSITLVVIGLGYLLRNTIWIRQALITPPPALAELLQSTWSNDTPTPHNGSGR